jgi:2,3-bisphosphoglycerate-independent phosphoglycerate mutase
VPAADYFAHRGNINEIENAVRNIDMHLLEVEEKALENDYNLMITADHGFIEQLANRNESNFAVKNHSNNPVPLIYISKGCERKAYNFGINDNLLSEILNSNNTVCDLAPTILDVFGIEKLDLMIGNPLMGGNKT